MRLFETDYKINFVDEADILVGFDMSQGCCENFGYQFTESCPSDISIEMPDLTNYRFDPSFVAQFKDGDTYRVYFKLSDSQKTIFLCLYNSHNGYYSHGFTFQSKNEIIKEGYL